MNKLDGQNEVNDVVLQEVMKSPQEKLAQMAHTNGAVLMVKGNKNNSLQTVIQCLANCDKFIRYIIKENYTKSTKELGFKRSKFFSEKLNKIFSSIYGKKLRIKDNHIDISDMH